MEHFFVVVLLPQTLLLRCFSFFFIIFFFQIAHESKAHVCFRTSWTPYIGAICLFVFFFANPENKAWKKQKKKIVISNTFRYDTSMCELTYTKAFEDIKTTFGHIFCSVIRMYLRCACVRARLLTKHSLCCCLHRFFLQFVLSIDKLSFSVFVFSFVSYLLLICLITFIYDMIFIYINKCIYIYIYIYDVRTQSYVCAYIKFAMDMYEYRSLFTVSITLIVTRIAYIYRYICIRNCPCCSPQHRNNNQ